MSLVDRFICRYEGHKLAFKPAQTPPVVITSWVTTCLRCGRAIKAVNPLARAAGGDNE